MTGAIKVELVKEEEFAPRFPGCEPGGDAAIWEPVRHGGIERLVKPKVVNLTIA